MMRKGQASLPLAFILAMAADASAALALDATPPAATPLQAGALRYLLDRAADAHIFTRDMDRSGDRRLPGDRTAQFPNFPNFPNFHNCFSGNWRNC